MKRKYPIILALIILVLVGCFVAWKMIKTSHQSTPPKSPAAKRAPLPKEVTVTLGKNGFTPTQVTIKVGSAIRWVNKSGKPETVNSDNYPTNQLHKELNFGEFANGSSVVYTFTKPGTYGYHNQFHHEQEGKVIVTK